jgi:hypothetical protein
MYKYNKMHSMPFKFNNYIYKSWVLTLNVSLILNNASPKSHLMQNQENYIFWTTNHEFVPKFRTHLCSVSSWTIKIPNLKIQYPDFHYPIQYPGFHHPYSFTCSPGHEEPTLAPLHLQGNKEDMPPGALNSGSHDIPHVNFLQLTICKALGPANILSSSTRLE